jgi:transcriptional regulator with XRE-family HTH domain
MDAVDDRRVGAILRMLRRRLGLRQVDVAARAGASQQTVSLIERMQLDRLSLRTIRAVFRAVGAEFSGEVRWRGSEIDRLMDEAHATLVGRFVVVLQALGWLTVVEATFSRYGERGSIDILAWHPNFGALLVVEVKSSLASIEELLRRLDAKVRLAPRIAAELFGARPGAMGRLVVLPDVRTERRNVARHSSVLDAVLPMRGWRVTRWLRAPSDSLAGVLFLSDTSRGGGSPTTGGRHRVRRSQGTQAERGSGLSTVPARSKAG